MSPMMVNWVCPFTSCRALSLTGILEELLIDFRELEGAHSGENMAEVVWGTLTLYGLREKVRINNVDITSYADVHRIFSSSL